MDVNLLGTGLICDRVNISQQAYVPDLKALYECHQFVIWFEQSSGETFSTADVDWQDVQD